MALQLPDFLKSFITNTSAKSRFFIILVAIVGIGFVIYLSARYLGGTGGPTGESRVAQAPAGLQSVPGGKMTPEFYRAVSQANVQAAQQAQITGGSAIPTLINIPGENRSDCTVLCSDETINVEDDINNLVRSGKLSKEEAAKLVEMSKNNVPVEEFSAQLSELVRQGKLTPEQARQLLEKYKKQYQNKALQAAGQTMDPLIKGGKLSLDTANQLLALQKSGISAAAYADELNRLVREGKISPEVAAQLLNEYTQQLQREKDKAATAEVNRIIKSGEVPPEVATAITNLQKRNASSEQFINEIDRQEKAGKLSGVTAKKLRDLYKRNQCQPSPVLNGVVLQAQSTLDSSVNLLQTNGNIQSGTAGALHTLVQIEVTPDEYQRVLAQLTQDKKISTQDSSQLLSRYQQFYSLKKETKALTDLQCKGVPINVYTDELKKRIQLGILTPEAAGLLLQEYKNSSVIAKPASVGATPTGVPGSEEFSQLQQRLQGAQATSTGAATTTDAAQFEAAAREAAAKAAEDREKRLQSIAENMSTQAQQLITAWQPPLMQHQAGTETEDKDKATGLVRRKEGETSEEISSKSGTASEPALIKAGTILFAVLDTGVNSDYPDTPVMATVVEGEFKGARLIGKLAVTTGSDLTTKDRVALIFNLMNVDGWPRSKAVNAFAMDPDTARTVMASDVDHHYLKRYGSLFASSFISGYADAVMQSGSTTTVSNSGTTTTGPPLGPRDKIAVGLGNVGKALSSAVAEYINIPPTVTVNAGVGIGVLFMSDLTDDMTPTTLPEEGGEPLPTGTGTGNIPDLVKKIVS